MIYLQDWDKFDNLFCIAEIENSKIEIDHSVSLKKQKINGYGVKYYDDFFGVYVLNNEINLIINDTIMNFDATKLKFYYQRLLFLEIVKIKFEKNCVFKKVYNVLTNNNSYRNISVDRIDKESDFFLQWCSRALKSKKQIDNLIIVWSNWYSDDAFKKTGIDLKMLKFTKQ
jgi:hypothetical protein